MVGFLLMAALERISHVLMRRRLNGSHNALATAPSAEHHAYVPAPAGPCPDPKGAPDREPSLRHSGSDDTATDGPRPVRLDAVALDVGPAKTHPAPPGLPSPPPSPHSHDAARLSSMAYLFELGCVMHSFIIGLMLGTAVEVGEVRALIIALSFHQFFEGLSLASVLLAAGLRRWGFALMVAVYSLTCPVGIAVGIGIADTYDSHSVTARAVQGTINGVSGGLLLYLAAALIMGEFAAGSGAGVGGCCAGAAVMRRREWTAWEHVLLFAMLCVGAGGFAVLAMWA